MGHLESSLSIGSPTTTGVKARPAPYQLGAFTREEADLIRAYQAKETAKVHWCKTLCNAAAPPEARYEVKLQHAARSFFGATPEAAFKAAHAWVASVENLLAIMIGCASRLPPDRWTPVIPNLEPVAAEVARPSCPEFAEAVARVWLEAAE